LTAAVAVGRAAELVNLEEEGASLAELAKRLDWQRGAETQLSTT